MIIVAYNLYTGKPEKWDVPTLKESIAHAKATFGTQWDKEEGEMVKGGLPILIKKC